MAKKMSAKEKLDEYIRRKKEWQEEQELPEGFVDKVKYPAHPDNER